MSDQHQHGLPLLTVEEVLRAHEDLREADRRIGEIEAEKRRLTEWLAMVAKVIGRERFNQILEVKPTLRETRSDRVTWTAFLDRLVRDRGGKLSYADAKDAIRENEDLGPILERTEKSFHGALAKLETAERIVRHQGCIFTPEAFAEHRSAVARGEIEEVSGAAGFPSRRSPMSEAVLRFIYDHPEGAVSKSVVEHIKGIEEFRAVVERNATNVYNILTRLVSRGQLRKEGTTYFPPEGREENSDTPEGAAA
ncbi:hypothetical protein IHQ68_03740 [Chelatococcus sambhunathii]|uniref:Uncharacterized protein n=1 Tax=Chelatococcus sambhunathii TaxID=363953 RepID=A0ABU1DCT7_9HYPH|nr:hypothetical protein [Chelatococcus sambhunathii]MDR4305735.1 hypothetical protein [Chelatococcus sambhunathii]